MSKIIGATVGTPLSPDEIRKKLNPVTTVNGVEPDEIGNVELAKPNLNQNDPEAPNYVEGRTHWVGTDTVVFINDTTVTIRYADTNADGYWKSGNYHWNSIHLDAAYNILVGEVMYNNLTWITNEHGMYLGNTSIYGIGDDTGEPFVIASSPDYEDCYYFVFKEPGQYTVSISYTKNVYTTLDEKFIPDTIARTADVIKTVNGNGPDENGDVTIDIPQGGSGVQANLEQNDPTAPDYVKGRTHWVEVAEVVFFDNITCARESHSSRSSITVASVTVPAGTCRTSSINARIFSFIFALLFLYAAVIQE